MSRLEIYKSIFAKSLLEKTITFCCNLNASSSDQMGEFKAKARAKYGSSLVFFLCGDILFASNKKSKYIFLEMVSIFELSSDNKKEKANSFISEYFFIFSLLFNNSSKENSG